MPVYRLYLGWLYQTFLSGFGSDERILLLALMGVEEAKIQMPLLQQVQLFQEVI
jgi:hypothetical protein